MNFTGAPDDGRVDAKACQETTRSMTEPERRLMHFAFTDRVLKGHI